MLYGWGGKGGKLFIPLYTHVSDLPSSSSYPMLCAVQDSLGSTITGGLYYITTSVHPVNIYGTSGGGGGAGMAIGGSVSGSTANQLLYTDGSGLLAQSGNYYLDPTNIALGLNVGTAPKMDFHLFHNESGALKPGIMIQRSVAGTGCSYINFYKTRGSFASPGTPSSGDSLGGFQFSGYNGTVPQVAALISARVTGTPSTTNMPGEMDFWTNNSATPSALLQVLSLDNTQTTNVKHLFVGSPSTSTDNNAQYSPMEILATEPGQPYAGTLMLNDNSGMAAGNGATINFGVEFNTTPQYTGGAMLKGYKANSTSGDYSAGLKILTRTNGSSQAEAARFTELQKFLVGGTIDNSTGLVQITSTTQPQLAAHYDATHYTTWQTNSAGKLIIVPSGGKMAITGYGSGTNTGTPTYALNVDASGNVIEGAISGGGSQTLQQVITTGSILSSSNTITGTGFATTIALGGSGTWKYTGMSQDTTNSIGLMGWMPDSSTRRFTWSAIAAKIAPSLPTDTLKALNGLTITGPIGGTDTISLGGTLNKSTSINMNGQTLSLSGGTSIFNLFTSLYFGYNSPSTSSNLTVTEGVPIYYLGAPSSNLTITLPSATGSGRQISFYNLGGTNTWSFLSNVYFPDLSTKLTTLNSDTWYVIQDIASTWVVINSFSTNSETNLSETSATTLTLSGISDYVFTGSSATIWTLPSLSGSQGKKYYIKNAGSASITLNAASGDHIYDTSQVTTLTITAGISRIIVAGSTNWYLE
jgi:hypothetical protein